MPDIFLSYSRDDQETARRFAEGFEAQGFSVWWDATLRSGEAYDQVTEKALADAKAVVVLWSKKSVDSRWVRAEATQADRNKTLVPVMIEPCKRPIMFELTHTADLSRWKGDASDRTWQTFLSDVRQFVGKDVAAASSPVMPHGAGRGKRIAIASLLVVALLLIAGGIQWALTRAGSGRSPAQAAHSASDGISLAVLPFVDLSPEHNQDYFSDGLAEELLNQLAQIKDLRLTARTSSFSFKGKNEDVRAIGEKLGVGNVLEGSVRKSGNRLRITAQLINAADGTHRWSETYNRELTDVFAVQEEIAMAVSQALSVTLDVGEMSRARGGTTNLEAYDKFLRAQALRRQQGGRKDILQASQFFREAVALDPKFVQGWSGLYAELTDQLIYIPENAAAARKEMSEVSAQLVALAPNDWRTQFMRADQFMAQRKWTEAEVAGGAAVASAPASGGISGNFYTIFLLNAGRISEAAPRVERNRQADPLSLLASYAQQIMLFLAGRPDEAQAEYERSKTLAGDHANVDFFALLRIWSRKNADPAAVKVAYQLYLQHGGTTAIDHLLADRLNNLDNKEAALAAIRQAFAESAYQTASGMRSLALLADHFGEKDLALAALRRSYVDLRGTNIGLIWQPFRTDLRADPRFKEILRDLGLVDYFRASGKWGDFCKPLGEDDFECR